MDRFAANGWRRVFPLFLASMLVAGCGGGGSLHQAPDDRGTMPVEGVEVRGQFLAPDGVTPLVNATVYAPGGAARSSIQKEAGCDVPTEPYSRLVCTDGQGRFVMTLPAGTTSQLVAIKGVFRTQMAVDTGAVAAGQSIDIGLLQPVITGDGAPRLAVVTGSYDRMEDLLAKSGFGETYEGMLIPGSETFQLYDGDDTLEDSYPSFTDLFADRGDGKTRLHDYAIVFINCGVYEYEHVYEDIDMVGGVVDPTDPNVVSALRTYVSEGGRLYLTDQAYDYLEQAFPEFIDFAGSEETLAATPEIPNAAEIGLADITVPNASVLVPALSSFLANVTCTGGMNCLNDDGTLSIEGFLSAWAVMEGAHPAAPAGLRFYVSGNISTSNEADVIKPLTASFNWGNGKVFYSSYHTENLGSTDFLPQERVLQFLVFE